MKKILINVKKEIGNQKKESIRLPKCWICMDDGLVYYDKKENGIIYEMAARCTCRKGQNSSERIRYVPHEIAEEIAKINFESFGERHPEQIKKLTKVG